VNPSVRRKPRTASRPSLAKSPSPTMNVAAQRRPELAFRKRLRDTEKAEPAVWTRVVVRPLPVSTAALYPRPRWTDASGSANRRKD
jgi:hypothetical protein